MAQPRETYNWLMLQDVQTFELVMSWHEFKWIWCVSILWLTKWINHIKVFYQKVLWWEISTTIEIAIRGIGSGTCSGCKKAASSSLSA